MARARHRIGMDSKAARGKVSLVIKIMKTLGEPSSSNMIRDTRKLARTLQERYEKILVEGE